MKNFRIKTILAFTIFLIILSASIVIFASNDGLQIVKKSEKEYLIYIENNLENAFEFAFSNNPKANIESLTFQKSAKDSESESANNIAYLDQKLYDEYASSDTYIWARTDNTNYIIEAKLLDLTSTISEEDIKIANNLTKNISVEIVQPTENIKDDDTKNIGKIVIKEEGKNFYQLAKVDEAKDVAKFAETIEDVINGKTKDDYYSELETAKKISDLYNKLLPKTDDKNWKETTNNEILKPEDAKDKDKYIVWIKNENKGKTKIDVQFLTCYEDYKTEVISEKVETKLPATSDDPTLFIILGVLVILFIITLVIRIAISKKKAN